MATVTFDPDKRRIHITSGPDASGTVVVDVQRDLYSEAKRQWLSDPVLNRIPFPFKISPSEPITPTKESGAYFFLRNDDGWRIVAYPADHEAVFEGNLYRGDINTPLFEEPPGGYSIATRLETSSLTQVVETGGGGGDVNVTQVGGVPVTGPDDLKADVSTVPQDVWAHPTRGLTEPVNLASQQQLDDMQAMLEKIFGVEFGGWAIENDGTGKAEWVIYDTDNTTVLARFSLHDKLGPSSFAGIPENTFIKRTRK